MAFGRQLRLLLWKNFTLRKRSPLRVVVEIVWPLILFLILMWVKVDNPDLQQQIHECHFDGKPMPSAGSLPFFQGFFCASNNTCYKTQRQSELPGQIDNYNTSIISQIFAGFDQLLSNSSALDGLDDVLSNLGDISSLLSNIQSVGSTTCMPKLSDLVLNSTALFEQARQLNISVDLLQGLLGASLNVSEVRSLVSGLGFFSMFQSPADIVMSALCRSDPPQKLLVLPPGSDLLQRLCAIDRKLLRDFSSGIISQLNRTAARNVMQNCGDTLSQKVVPASQIENIMNAYNSPMWGVISESFGSVFGALNGTLIGQRNSTNGSNATIPMMQMARILLCQSDADALGDETYDKQYMDQLKQDAEDNSEFDYGNGSSTSSSSSSTYTYDNTTSLYCNRMFRQFEKSNSDIVRMLWRQFKPLIRGKIPYTPDTPVVRRIIKQANRTFENWASVQRVAADWIDLSPRIYDFMNNSQQINSIRLLIDQLIPISPRNQTETLLMAKHWLNNGVPDPQYPDWRDTLNSSDVIMSSVREIMECIVFDKFEAFSSEEQLVDVSLKYIERQSLWAALVFNVDANKPDVSNSSIPAYVSYKIRMDSDRVDSTRKFKVTDRYWQPGPRARPIPDMKYIVYGFAYLQDMIEHGIIRERTGGSDDIGIALQQFPYPCYIKDRFVMAIARTMPLFMTLAWIFTAAMIVKGIVYEKERRLKEVMKVMGLGNDVHWLSWFITSFVMMLVSILLLIAVLKGGRILEKTDGLVVFVFMIAFTIATITQCFMFSVFFSRANLAAACAAIFYFIGYLPYAFVVQWEEYMVNWQKALACLSSTVAFGFGCSYIAKYEEQGVGSQWSNFKSSPIPEDDFNLACCIVMMLVDSAIYFVITWYVEAVFPGEFGVPKRWYFPVTKSYWCSKDYPMDCVTLDQQNIELSHNTEASENFETEPKTLPLGVAVRNLRKIYKQGNKVAVDGLSMNFYEGQITSFLGHNGAGKTTTISILTGLFPPTEGTALIYGRDVRYEMDVIRQDMGMCPQHNVLFDSLTVEEHLYFYGCLKGMSQKAIKEEMKQMICDVGLPHKRQTLAKDLSGGMQRKLSIAVAFTAGSRIVILDEPTAGVDPYARRSIWDLLLKYKAGRTIILSTHFMDEADILGDRIAIISQGQLRCCGSSLFLKKRFASGYYLTIVLSDEERKRRKNKDKALTSKPSGKAGDGWTIEGSNLTSSNVDVPAANGHANSVSATASEAYLEASMTSFIRGHVSEAELVESLSSELTYQLPDDMTSVAKFNKLFSNLDANREDLGISSYGISSTTLEEVFLKVAKHSEGDIDNERLPIELLTDGGTYARPVTRLSLRHAKQRFLGLLCRDSPDRDIMLDDDVLLVPDAVEELDLPLLKNRFSEEFYEDDVCRNNGDSSCSHGSAGVSTEPQCNGAGSYRVSGVALLRSQFWALFLKRFHYVRRSKKAFVSQIILPAIFICIAMIFSKINPPVAQLPEMEVHPWLLAPIKMNDSHLYVFYSTDQKDNFDDSSWSSVMKQMLTKEPGLGTRCMDPEVHTIDGFPCPGISENASSWTQTVYSANDSKTCSCETGFQQCPKDAAGTEPSRLLLPTGDILYNMTDRNISEWLVKTTYDYIKKRYGGLSFGQRNQLMRANVTQLKAVMEKIAAALNVDLNRASTSTNVTVESFIDSLSSVFSQLATQKNAKVWFDNTGYVSMVAYMNAMNNLLYRASFPSVDERMKAGITVINHPMNRTKSQMATYTLQASAIDALIAISVIFAMSQIPASFVVFLVEERHSGSRHLQFVSGVKPVVFWLVNFTWDMCNYLVSSVLCIILFMAFQQRQYVSADNAPCLVALLFLYGWAMTPLMYPLSFMFKVPSTAFVLVGCANIFLGLLSTLSTFILELFMEERLDKINAILKKVFLLLPHFCLGRGLIDMTRNQLVADIFATFGEKRFRNPVSWDLVGKNLFTLSLLGILFFMLTICIEYRFWYYKLPCFAKFSGSSALTSSGEVQEEDVDVNAERQRVVSGNTEGDVLVLDGLTKLYKKRLSGKRHMAVDNIAVGVHKGECFGLLGVNGAGKTTTFKMLTGDTSPMQGDARLAGFSILTNMVDVHQHLGYCPQFDALCSLLNTSEHLQLYARLRGVPEPEIPMVVQWAMRRLGLTQHATKRSCDLSGGNRRKLSTAIALVGNPDVIFLDEPTTGMDPKARRFLWNCISDIVRDGRSVVLTSHSMEECEALCSRIAIMVNGTFQCLGSIQHLKNRFGDGYTVTIRLSSLVPKLSAVKSFVKSSFVDCQLKEQHQNVLHYQLTADCASLAEIFGRLESARQQFGIEDYSVSQTTLDQVFINFARLQTDLMDDEVAAESYREQLQNNGQALGDVEPCNV